MLFWIFWWGARYDKSPGGDVTSLVTWYCHSGPTLREMRVVVVCSILECSWSCYNYIGCWLFLAQCKTPDSRVARLYQTVLSDLININKKIITIFYIKNSQTFICTYTRMWIGLLTAWFKYALLARRQTYSLRYLKIKVWVKGGYYDVLITSV